MGDRMAKMRDLTEKQAATTGPKSQEDWRKKALYNLPHTSEAAQERTSSSSGQDLKQDAGNVLADRRQQLRELRWQKNRGGGAAASTEHQIHWDRRQESKAKSRHSNTHQLGRRKGWSNAAIEHFAKWHKGESSDQQLDLIKERQNQYIANNYYTEDSKTES